ncbi:hypothetical protein DFN06_003074 [Clostridium beijerinckii]|jgi:hypothetical protein|nr:hypothetical protein [Clostridium beijerinckii]NOV70804.1 hypothetical protein [Clostridium beijerinckii]NOW33721.1 hypothetical protein [Clostridium beijerinckii]NOW83389.1 hypothetical protein [Clostridium beijerinckii]NRZ27358.1 hypothetical protein [Clostridium beijerinckii]
MKVKVIKLNGGQFANVTIPSSVTKMSNAIFLNCLNLAKRAKQKI